MVNDLLASADIVKLFALTGILTFIAVLWQVIPLMLNSDNEKLVAQKKSNIKKILVAFAILISIEVFIAGAGALAKLINGKGYTTSGNGKSNGMFKENQITEMQ